MDWITVTWDWGHVTGSCECGNELHPVFLVILLVTRNKGRGGWRRQGRYTKSKLQQTISFIEVEPLNVYQNTHTYVLLAVLIFPK